MSARQFFAILESSRKQERIRYNSEMADLCDVTAIAICSGKYAEDLRKFFVARATGGQWRRGTTVKMDHKDPRAPAILQSIFQQKGKLEGLNG